MRSFLALVAVTCLLLAAPVMAQTPYDAGATCLNLTEFGGPSLGDHWSDSFSMFLDTYHGELSEEQRLLIQQAIDLGSFRNLKMDSVASIHAMRGLMVSVRDTLSIDQFSEILARMGPESQQLLVAVSVIEKKDIACSCTAGASRGCPEGYPCTVGCHTWGTGAWNGLCVGDAVATQN